MSGIAPECYIAILAIMWYSLNMLINEHLPGPTI